MKARAADLPAATLFDVTNQRCVVVGDGLVPRAIASVLDRSGAAVRTVEEREPAGIAMAIASAVEELGGLDVGVVATAEDHGGGYLQANGRIEALAADAWDGAVATTLHAGFFALQAIAAPMREARSGRIVFVSTRAARRSDPFNGYGDVAAGAGLINLARQAAFELAPDGVLVNTIAAGPLSGTADARQEAETVPLGRLGEPADLEGAALFFASAASSFVAGSILTIDGGSMTRQNALPRPS